MDDGPLYVVKCKYGRGAVCKAFATMNEAMRHIEEKKYPHHWVILSCVSVYQQGWM